MNRQKLPKVNRQKIQAGFKSKVKAKETRKLRARQEKHNLWFGLGLLGLVGWSIIVPTLLGLALGIWIEGRFPSRFSWTLMLMFAGLALGCLNAWTWVNREQAMMEMAHLPPPEKLPPHSSPTPEEESNHE